MTTDKERVRREKIRSAKNSVREARAVLKELEYSVDQLTRAGWIVDDLRDVESDIDQLL